MSTNFPGGVTQAEQPSTLGYYRLPDPTAVHTQFDDFDNYTAGEWTVTTTGTGTVATENANNGILVLTNSAANNDALFLQWSGLTNAATVETFKFSAPVAGVGVKAWFKARFKVSDATNSALVMGLQVTDTTPLAVSDGLYFLKAAASTTLNLLATKASTSTTVAAATMVDDTYLTVGYEYNGYDTINIFANDIKVGTMPTTNLPTAQTLTLSFGVQNGAAAAKTMRVDYIFASMDRA